MGASQLTWSDAGGLMLFEAFRGFTECLGQNNERVHVAQSCDLQGER